MTLNYLPFEPLPDDTLRHRGVRWQRVALVLVFCWFLFGGAAHFLFTEAETRFLPSAVPDPRDVVLLIGVFQLIGAVGLLLPWTRRAAGWALFLLTLALTLASVYMLHAHDSSAALPPWLLWARLPLQLVLLWLIHWGSHWRRPSRSLY